MLRKLFHRVYIPVQKILFTKCTYQWRKLFHKMYITVEKIISRSLDTNGDNYFTEYIPMDSHPQMVEEYFS